MAATLRINSFLDIVNIYWFHRPAKGCEDTYSLCFNKRLVADHLKAYVNRLTPYVRQGSGFATTILESNVPWTTTTYAEVNLFHVTSIKVLLLASLVHDKMDALVQPWHEFKALSR